MRWIGNLNSLPFPKIEFHFKFIVHLLKTCFKFLKTLHCSVLWQNKLCTLSTNILKSKAWQYRWFQSTKALWEDIKKLASSKIQFIEKSNSLQLYESIFFQLATSLNINLFKIIQLSNALWKLNLPINHILADLLL